jgi:hypothetical protein
VRVAALFVLALALCVTATARADGDPASDELVYENAYLPPSTSSAALARRIAAVYAAGERVKVAVIATKADLGAIPSLYGKPATYAHFLGEEISTVFVGPLLIVMPAGYGIWDGGRSVSAERAVLAGLGKPVSARPGDLAADAATAVSRLAVAGALRSKDVLAPFVTAMGARVKKRGRLTVRYYAYDDSGRAAVSLLLLRDGRTVLTHALPASLTNISKIHTTTLPLPAGLSLVHARFCLTATDAAGNRSTRSCRGVSR